MYKPFINVAEIGNYQGISGGLYQRSQFVGLNGGQSNQGLNGTYSITDNSTTGLGVTNQMIGEGFVNKSKIMAKYSHRLQFNAENNQYLLMGISAGVELYNVDKSNVSLTDVNDELINNLDFREYTSPQLNIGFSYYHANAYGGLSVVDMFKTVATDGSTDMSFMDINNATIYLYGGYKLDLSEKWKMDLSSLIRYSGSSNVQVDINTHAVYNNLIGMGLSYRTSNELYVNTSIKCAKNITVGYGFEYHLANTSLAHKGTHEVMLVYALDFKDNTTLPVDSLLEFETTSILLVQADSLAQIAVTDSLAQVAVTDSLAAVKLANTPPDMDGDGVIDEIDDCIDVAGTAEYNGCSEEVIEDLKIQLAEYASYIKFGNGKKKLSESVKQNLSGLVDLMNKHPHTIFNIEGYSDSVGNEESNQKLSEIRANSVMQFLIDEGVDENMVRAYGYGEDNPIADNNTREGRAKNRRIEIQIGY